MLSLDALNFNTHRKQKSKSLTCFFQEFKFSSGDPYTDYMWWCVGKSYMMLLFWCMLWKENGHSLISYHYSGLGGKMARWQDGKMTFGHLGWLLAYPLDGYKVLLNQTYEKSFECWLSLSNRYRSALPFPFFSNIFFSFFFLFFPFLGIGLLVIALFLSARTGIYQVRSCFTSLRKLFKGWIITHNCGEEITVRGGFI